ncbi:MAG: TIGR01244 family sulfur transferase [Rhodanobacter sp.]
MPNLKWTFLLATLLGVAIVVAMATIDRPHPAPHVLAKRLAGAVWITEQISESQLADIKAQGFRTVIDLRPDGEAVNQPAAADVARAAQAAGLTFGYVPVPHGDVPEATVDALGRSLAQAGRPVLLYCRSGHRAARTWALAEASRVAGLDAAAIQSAVRSAGQTADDLGAQIATRIAARSSNR